ncbi:MFS transporter [Glutamicibacter arilaitensis]|uniref:MFS transporter n=2 Tax=Micrococcales TaxID=85006 RepID=UPI0015E181F8|nr:MFS transporter [Glutamicibacter arilaitensis]
MDRAPLSITFFVVLALVVLSQLYGALVLGPASALDLGADPGTSELVQSLFGVAYAIGFLVWGPAVDRYGATRCFLIGLTVLLAATVFVACAPSMSWLLGGRIVQGAAAASFAPSVFAYFGARLPTAVRLIAVTVLTSSFLAAAVLAQVLAQLVVLAGSWRWFFILSAITLTLGLVLAMRGLRPTPGSAETGQNATRILAGLLGRLRIVLLLIATLAILGPFIALYAALGHTGHYPDSELLMLRLSALPALIWAGAASPWLTRIRPSTRMITAFTGAALASTLLVFTGHSVLGAGFGMLLLATCVSVLAPATIQTLTGMSPEHYGSVTALYTFALFLGASLAALPIPVLATLAQVSTTGLVQVTALIAIPIFLLALTFTIFGSRTPQQPQ